MWSMWAKAERKHCGHTAEVILLGLLIRWWTVLTGWAQGLIPSPRMGDLELPVLPDIGDIEVPEFPIKWVLCHPFETVHMISTQIQSCWKGGPKFLCIYVSSVLSMCSMPLPSPPYKSLCGFLDHLAQASEWEEEEEDEEGPRADGRLHRGVDQQGLETPQLTWSPPVSAWSWLVMTGSQVDQSLVEPKPPSGDQPNIQALTIGLQWTIHQFHNRQTRRLYFN